jgi:hypothetical protein
MILASLEHKLAATLPAQQRADEAEKIYRAALTRLDRLSTTANTHQLQSQRLTIILSLMDTLYFQGKSEEMDALKEQTRALLAGVGTAIQRSNYRSRLNQIAFIRNRHRAPSENIVNARNALIDARESGDSRLIARQQFHLGFQLLWHVQWCGYLDDAEDQFQQSLRSATELGDYWLQNQCLVYLNILYRVEGRDEQVLAQLPHLIDVSNSVDNSRSIHVAQANTAWLHYRGEEWDKAQAHAEAAVANLPIYPIGWLANWIVLALAVREYRLPDANAAARAMLNPKQQKQLDEVEVFLQTAVSAWEVDDVDGAIDALETAVKLATQYGYL